jgi:phage tail protein X
MMVGYSNKTLSAPLPVLKRFKHRGPTAIGVVKSIVHAPDFGALMNPHAVTLKKPDASYTQDQAKQVQHWAMDVVHTGRPA